MYIPNDLRKRVQRDLYPARMCPETFLVWLTVGLSVSLVALANLIG